MYTRELDQQMEEGKSDVNQTPKTKKCVSRLCKTVLLHVLRVFKKLLGKSGDVHKILWSPPKSPVKLSRSDCIKS